ncbi:uncharacterized protein F4822DRAFT_36209 [Hypoxylon trugodes]|uniref:uncharacterized protein n=1 Tax=Hypoxylon trugodes TaxID=326681 RepID=UPI0021978C8C|nr:uncharacterized protein F4822DRAFT_36209 [Hypoxylon trugodes]KAI1394080.1 hypothetical protein F4822DRAFT_36209 [Hypoxylon trugodes]
MGSSNDANLARLRDNQRKSRARRKEYVNSIERQLRDYHRRGVESTAEIQRAARRVAEENKKMRALLNRIGFDDGSISCFLQTGSLDPAGITTPNPTCDRDNNNELLE